MIEPLGLPGVFLITGSRHEDARGSFGETYRASWLAEAGFEAPFVQENLVTTRKAGVLRGLHFQREPFGQDKLVQALVGTIFDVAVDIRPGSPTLGRWIGRTLSADVPAQIFIPRGFAHGYLTLTDDCMVAYRVSAYYAPQAEAGIRWDDPALGVDWPLPPEAISTNARDQAWPTLAEAMTA